MAKCKLCGAETLNRHDFYCRVCKSTKYLRANDPVYLHAPQESETMRCINEILMQGKPHHISTASIYRMEPDEQEQAITLIDDYMEKIA